jgi:hypothetical protein
MVETNTNPFDDLATNVAICDIEEPIVASPESGDAKPFEDEATDSEAEEEEDYGFEELNSDKELDTKPPAVSTNPFDDDGDGDDDDADQVTPDDAENGAVPLGDKRNRFNFDGDDGDSVQSMLEMMQTKHRTVNNKKKLLSKAIRSRMTKWKWTSNGHVQGENSGSKNNDNDDDDDDDDSQMSYDCIALDSLKDKLRNGETRENIFDDMDDDIESTRSKSRGDDAKSDGTPTTKNSGNESDGASPEGKQLQRRLNMKYVIPLASFLAIVLLLGIIILSYALYALRKEDGEDLSVFTKEFWNEDLPEALAFWKKGDESEP